MNSQQYYDLYLKKPNEDICPVCGKHTKWWSLDRGYMQHCSYKCTQNDPNVVDKREKHFLDKYGVKNPYQAEEVKDKIKQHNLDVYGYEYTLQRPEVIEKGRKTKLYKYGSETYNNSKQAQQTCLERYGTDCFSAGGIVHSSKEELKLLTIIQKYCSYEIKSNIKTVISPLELDLYIPDLKLAFEYNGQYWHSVHNVSKDYHYNKSKMCFNNGIRLVHFYGFEDWDFIEQFVKNIFSKTEVLTNDFNKFSPLQFNYKNISFSGPTLLKDDVYGSGTFSLFR